MAFGVPELVVRRFWSGPEIQRQTFQAVSPSLLASTSLRAHVPETMRFVELSLARESTPGTMLASGRAEEAPHTSWPKRGRNRLTCPRVRDLQRCRVFRSAPTAARLDCALASWWAPEESLPTIKLRFGNMATAQQI